MNPEDRKKVEVALGRIAPKLPGVDWSIEWNTDPAWPRIQIMSVVAVLNGERQAITSPVNDIDDAMDLIEEGVDRFPRLLGIGEKAA